MPDDSDETGLTDADRIRTAREYAAKALHLLPSEDDRPQVQSARLMLFLACGELDEIKSPIDEVAKVMPE